MIFFPTLVRALMMNAGDSHVSPCSSSPSQTACTTRFLVLLDITLHAKRLQAAEVAVEGRSLLQLGLLPWTIHPTTIYTLSSEPKLSFYCQLSRKITLTEIKLKSVRYVIILIGKLFSYTSYVRSCLNNMDSKHTCILSGA